MGVLGALDALFFDVRHLAAGGDLAVPTDDTAARKRRESEQANETHGSPLNPFCKRCTAELLRRRPWILRPAGAVSYG
jgi:hypothetical protein